MGQAYIQGTYRYIYYFLGRAKGKSGNDLLIYSQGKEGEDAEKYHVSSAPYEDWEHSFDGLIEFKTDKIVLSQLRQKALKSMFTGWLKGF